MFRGATTGVLESWDACAAWKIIRTKKVRMISGTAIRLSELVDYAIEKNFESGSLRLVLSGGSAGIGRIREKWEKLGVRFVETYGMSELGGTAAMGFPHPFETKPVSPFLNVGAIGPPPPDKEVLIVNEAGRALDPGTPGKIEIRGGFMSGYWKMPKETAKTTRGGWLRTSDIGYIDELDNVYWLARQTDLIITEMGQVFPRVIEEALFTHPFVRQVSVKGITTLKSQYQTPVGFVTLFAGKSANEKELLDYCKAKLDRKFWPSRIIIRDQFPMTPTGKINKKLLSVD
jgi:acyl-CoA synthetase (AMP-forming)/AMP-acid ligase II